LNEDLTPEIHMKTVKATQPKAIKATPKTTTKAPAAMTARNRGGQATALNAAAKPITAPGREITTELIAARAFVIWEQQGRPHGRDVANWLLAESQLKQEIQPVTA
jgi:hypothetical protein